MEKAFCDYCAAAGADRNQKDNADGNPPITYLCKYTPLELMKSFGVNPEMPNADVPDFSDTEPYIHSMVCSHAKMLLLSLMEEKDQPREVILTTCCDSVRRVRDSVPQSDFAFLEMLDLPHRNTGYGVRRYAEELQRLSDRYAAYSGKKADREILLKEWKQSADACEDLFENKGKREFIAVLGARPSDELLQKMRAVLSLPVVDLTCGGLRSLPQPPENAKDLSDAELLSAYAGALLGQVPCMRMEDISGREKLFQISGLSGIVYHTVRFCDFYAFEYAQLQKECRLPMLKIESDYTAQSSGQIATRLAAFEESLGVRVKSGGKTQDSFAKAGEHPEECGEKASGAGKHPGIQGRTDNKDGKSQRVREISGIFVGIDSGSTTTNVAAIDQSGNLLAYSVVRTGARASAAAQRAFQKVRQQLGNDAGRIRRIVATGYGREAISFADAVKTEISCHAKGAHFSDPEARTIIDIGGQDSKVICLDENGNVINFVMNDKCAAGTGRFLEMMAHTLEMDLTDMSRMGLKWKRDLNITSTCSVFAESEVVSLIAENAETRDIIHALNKSVAQKTSAMVKRARGKKPYMMTGGVAKNEGVVREIGRSLKAPLTVMDHPDLTGALGAALYAAER